MPHLELLALAILCPLITRASLWVECPSSICVECHEVPAQAPISIYRWYSTGWYDCQAGSALSYTEYCTQQPLPFNQTPSFSSIFSTEKEIAFGTDGSELQSPFLVKIPFKPTSPMTTASLNTSSTPAAIVLHYSAPTAIHDIIPIKLTLPMCVPPVPSAQSAVSGSIGMFSPAGSNGLWLYIVDKRGLSFAGGIANASVPRRSPASQMAAINASHAFTAASGCKYVYAVLYVAHPFAPAVVDVSFEWLSDTSLGRGAVLSFDYLSAEKFEFDSARIEGLYGSLLPVCDPQRCDGRDALFDAVIDGLGGATLTLVTFPLGDVSSPNGIRLNPVGGDGYRVGNVLEFPTSLFGASSSSLMVTVTGVEPVRVPLPLRLLSSKDALLVPGIETTDVWAEFEFMDVDNTSNSTSEITIDSPPKHFVSVSPRVASSSMCSSRSSHHALTVLANSPVGPALSLSSFSGCRRVCRSSDVVSGPAAVVSSGDDRCGANVFVAGDTATILCSEGHWLSSGSKQRLCLFNYTFDGSAECSPLVCPALTAPLHGSLLPAPYWQAKFACDANWKLDGYSSLSCMTSGQWDLPIPTCTPIFCTPASPPQHGRINVKPLLNYSGVNSTQYSVAFPQTTQPVQSGVSLTVSCDSGYSLVGHGSVVCETSGVFNSSLGICLPVPCLSFSTLNLPSRAIAVPPFIRYSEFAVVTCESGYRFETGDSEISAWCDIHGNISTATPLPPCLRIPNFCEGNAWACGVIISWPFVLAAVASVWFYVLQSVLVTVVLPSTGDQISFRCIRLQSLSILPGFIRTKWSLMSDEFILRIVYCSRFDDIVTACRRCPDQAAELSPPLMLKRLHQLRLPQLSRFWDPSPRLVLCVCPRQDSRPVFDKQSASSSSMNKEEQVDATGIAHKFAAQGVQRWRHIHSSSLASIAPSSSQPLAPSRASKVFSWMRSNKEAWEIHDETSYAWQSTFREETVWQHQSNEVISGFEQGCAAGELDLNRWVAQGAVHVQETRSLVPYEISVVTGSELGAGTDSRVFCTIYGEDGAQSAELALSVSLQNSDPFETGKTDTFRHVLPQLGRVSSIRIRYDATGFGSDWLLDRVRVKDATSGEVTEFEHGGWLSENATFVHLQAQRCSAVFVYEIMVVTGSDVGAGTDSAVYCTLFGSACVGNSGEFLLKGTANSAGSFQSGATSIFHHFSHRSLGCISSVCIRLDALGFSSDWQLKCVRVRDVTSGEVMEFEHGGWLSKNNCSILLTSEKPPVQSPRLFCYEICVDTGSDAGSGTDANVFCMLYGDNGINSGELPLAHSLQHVDAFEKGYTDTFIHLLPQSLGRVHFIRIRHDGSGIGSSWKLERVRVKDCSTGVSIEFDYGDWLTSRCTEVLIPLFKDKPTFIYEITVVTGNDLGAGTNANVFCSLHGTAWCNSGEVALVTSLTNPDPFEKGKSDTFRHVFPHSLGRIASIRIRFDATGLGSDWLLDRISVKDVQSGEIQEFHHADWLTHEKREVLLEALPVHPVADSCGMSASPDVRAPPALSLPGAVADFSVAACASEELGQPSGESCAEGMLNRTESVADLETTSIQLERLRRAEDMLLRLGISKKSFVSAHVVQE